MSQNMYTLIVNATAQGINAYQDESAQYHRAYDAAQKAGHPQPWTVMECPWLHRMTSLYNWLQLRYGDETIAVIFAEARAVAAHDERDRVELHYIDLVATYLQTTTAYHNCFAPRSLDYERSKQNRDERQKLWQDMLNLAAEMRDIEARYGFEYMSYL